MKNLFFITVLFFIPHFIYPQWQMMSSPFATPEIRKVVHHPEGYMFAVSNQNEVFRSIDQITWTKLTTLNDDVTSLNVSPQGIIYAGTLGGYFFSADTGITWLKKGIYEFGGSLTDFEFNSLGYIFASSYCLSGCHNGV